MNVELTGSGVVALAAVGVVGVVGYKIAKHGPEAMKKFLGWFDPTEDTNLAYQGANNASIAVQNALGLSGQHGGYSYDDHLFAAIDLLNPFNASDDYAKIVWGLK